jgi:hypothetical protein
MSTSRRSTVPRIPYWRDRFHDRFPRSPNFVTTKSPPQSLAMERSVCPLPPIWRRPRPGVGSRDGDGRSRVGRSCRWQAFPHRVAERIAVTAGTAGRIPPPPGVTRRAELHRSRW